MKIRSRVKYYFSDTMAMSGRMLRHNFRSIDTIITVVAMPIMMMLMFVYVCLAYWRTVLKAPVFSAIF